MANVSLLYDLQELDLSLSQGRHRLQTIASTLGDDSLLVPLRRSVAALETEVSGISVRQRELDDTVTSLAQHVRQVETKLYGGAVRNPRELSDLQADLGQLTRQRSQQEERLLDILDQFERLRGQLEDQQATLLQQESAWRESQAAMAQEQEALRAEQTQLAGQRSLLTGRISPADLAVYDQVRRSHGGQAVARVQRGTCEGCRVGLPSKQLQALRASSNLVQCPSCGLLLFLMQV